jgi:hypothetical protein
MEEVRRRVRHADAEERRAAREAIGALARPRMCGSDGAREVDAVLRSLFEGVGYQIQELPFHFSTWPGCYGVAAAGALYLTGMLAAVALLVRGAGGAMVMAVLLTLPLLFFALARSLPALIASLPWGRTAGANWLVSRPGARPRTLIVAHRDSKSQPFSTLGRTLAVATAVLAWAALLLLAGALVVDAESRWIGGSAALEGATLTVGTLALLAGCVLLFCRAGNDSPGALDNATGLAALIGIARREAAYDDVAFLVTDGEELGLAGAGAAAPLLPPALDVINLDSLDDVGSFYLVERYGWPRRGEAPRPAAALRGAAEALELPIAARDLPPGILVDHIPLAAAGHAALTLFKGERRSFLRIHRPADCAECLSGEGAATAVALVSGALALLRESAVR